MPFARLAFGLISISAAFGQPGVLSHVAAGGGWTTAITLINQSLAGRRELVTVSFTGDDGRELVLPITTIQGGISRTVTSQSVAASLDLNETLVISIGDQLVSTVTGWAAVVSSGGVDTFRGHAIFRYAPQGGQASEGTVPLTRAGSKITLPYDNTAGFVMGVAITNPTVNDLSLVFTFLDETGKQLATVNGTIKREVHFSFVLPEVFPPTAGRRGLLIISIVKGDANSVVAGLGLRFSSAGTFTSVPTF